MVGGFLGVQAVSFPAPAAFAADNVMLVDARTIRPENRQEEICLRVIFLRPFKRWSRMATDLKYSAADQSVAHISREVAAK